MLVVFYINLVKVHVVWLLEKWELHFFYGGSILDNIPRVATGICKSLEKNSSEYEIMKS